MPAKTATVEVLTAEVRVVQVGSRQVTLSVVRQLDWAGAEDVEPFGRVRTGDDSPGRVEIIGSQDGVLVRSRAWRTVHACRRVQRGGYGACTESQALHAEAKGHSDRGNYGEAQKARKRLSAHEDHDWTVYGPDQQTYEMWQSLPLIVLAGLRLQAQAHRDAPRNPGVPGLFSYNRAF
jgi:hypothetical protein